MIIWWDFLFIFLWAIAGGYWGTYYGEIRKGFYKAHYYLLLKKMLYIYAYAEILKSVDDRTKQEKRSQ